MMVQLGAPLTAALLLEINPLLLTVMTAGALTHEATATWDVRTAEDSPRELRPAEQMIHSFLESLPFVAVSSLAILHWDQVRTLLRAPQRRDAWTLRRKQDPLPRRYIAGVLRVGAALIAVPYGEELTRCVIAGRRRRSPAGTTGSDNPERAGGPALPGARAADTGRGRGPEDVVVTADGRVVTGVADGRLLSLDLDGPVRVLADTGGRPLGIESLPDGRLLVRDAHGVCWRWIRHAATSNPSFTGARGCGGAVRQRGGHSGRHHLLSPTPPDSRSAFLGRNMRPHWAGGSCAAVVSGGDGE